MDKSRRDSERDHYFRSLKRNANSKDQNDPNDWTRYTGRIQHGANINDQVWDTSDAPEIRDHYLRSMRSANDPQPNNVIRDHYLRSMRSADNPQTNNVIRDHYLRSMRSANNPQQPNEIRDHYLRSMRSANKLFALGYLHQNPKVFF